MFNDITSPTSTQLDSDAHIAQDAWDKQNENACFHTRNKLSQSQLFMDTCIKIYDVVRNTCLPNFLQARIPIPQNLNISAWRRYLEQSAYGSIVDFLEFGWPIGYTLPSAGLQATHGNHASALAYPQHVDSYIKEELQRQTLLGPFQVSPFASALKCSPLMTRAKRGDTNKRRTIMDLSWPHGSSVNDGIAKDNYLGIPFKLRFPTIDDLTQKLLHKGPNTPLFVCDISAAYRNLRTDPLTWPCLGFEWGNQLFVDISAPFGLRSAALMCQATTDALVWILYNHYGVEMLNYIDDLCGIGNRDIFYCVLKVLHELGLPVAPNKIQSPTTCVIWLGIEIDSQNMEIRIPPDRLEETISLLRVWKYKSVATMREIQQILGKLHHISRCCKPARLFVNRMLDTLRHAYHAPGNVELNSDFKKDIQWFLDFLPAYNGKTFIRELQTRYTVELDSSLTGCGAIMRDSYYSTQFPEFILQEHHPIVHLEMLNLVIAAKVWANKFSGHKVTFLCDNAVAVSVLSTGRARDAFLLRCAREIWLQMARFDFHIAPEHRPAVFMETADALSRAHTSQRFRDKLSHLPKDQMIGIDTRLFRLTSTY